MRRWQRPSDGGTPCPTPLPSLYVSGSLGRPNSAQKSPAGGKERRRGRPWRGLSAPRPPLLTAEALAGTAPRGRRPGDVRHRGAAGRTALTAAPRRGQTAPGARDAQPAPPERGRVGPALTGGRTALAASPLRPGCVQLHSFPTEIPQPPLVREYRKANGSEVSRLEAGKRCARATSCPRPRNEGKKKACLRASVRQFPVRSNSAGSIVNRSMNYNFPPR